MVETIDDNNNRSMKWGYLVRSFLKLEKLDIIMIDYKNTCGIINSLNADRFHITLFGNKLLYYMDK